MQQIPAANSKTPLVRLAYNIDECAVILGFKCSESVRRLVSRGLLSAMACSQRRLLISAEELADFVKRQTKKNVPTKEELPEIPKTPKKARKPRKATFVEVPDLEAENPNGQTPDLSDVASPSAKKPLDNKYPKSTGARPKGGLTWRNRESAPLGSSPIIPAGHTAISYILKNGGGEVVLSTVRNADVAGLIAQLKRDGATGIVSRDSVGLVVQHPPEDCPF